MTLLCTTTFSMKNRHSAAEQNTCSSIGCKDVGGRGKEGKKKKAPNSTCSHMHVCSIQLQGSLDFIFFSSSYRRK